MIGNDVVDLDDEESRSFHPRFDERVFAATERRALEASADPHRLRWLLWAAKESAYKLLRRTLPDLVFSPSRFVSRPAGPNAATVEASGHVVRVRYECGAGFVHCVAGYHGADATLAEVARLPESCSEAGQTVRRLAVRAIARHLALEEGWLRVERAGRMPVVIMEAHPLAETRPLLERCSPAEPRPLSNCRQMPGSRPLPGTLSLSHHGRFVAFAWRSGLAGRPRGTMIPGDAGAAVGASR